MLDKRKSLVGGFALVLHEDTQYIITEEIGRGGSCLVYDASYTDAAGCCHQVRIKECFPYDMEVWRNENGELEAADSCREEFRMAKEKFCKAYRDNAILKNTLGLMNSTMGTAGLYGKNNTFYSVMECVEGTDYRTESDEDLRSVLIRMRTLSRIIKKYHDQKLLHLDIKPENILVIPETKEHMVLFDFDSLVSMKELEEEKEFRTAFSDGFAAPELAQERKDKICPATDIYSIGAVLFYKVFGRIPDAMDTAMGSEYHFDEIKYTVPKYRPEFYEKLDAFLHRMISSSVSCRIKSIDEVLEGLEELLLLMDMPKSKKNRNLLILLACFVAVAGLSLYGNSGIYNTGGNMQLIEVYLQNAQSCQEEKEYPKAIRLLKNGIEENEKNKKEKEKLEAFLEEVCGEAVDYYSGLQEYAVARTLLEEALTVSENAKLWEWLLELYQRESDACIAKEDYLAAIQLCADAQKAAADASDTKKGAFFAGREDYLRSHIEVSKKTAYYSHTGEITEEYFEEEKRVKKIDYREKGNIRMFISWKEGGENVVLYEEYGKMEKSYWISYQYDGEGRIKKKQIAKSMEEEKQGSYCAELTYEYDGEGRIASVSWLVDLEDGGEQEWLCREYEYDGTGKMLKERIYKDSGNAEEIWYQYQYGEDGRLEKRYSFVKAGKESDGDAEWQSDAEWEPDVEWELDAEWEPDEEWKLDAELEYDILGNEKRYRARDGEEIVYSYEYSIWPVQVTDE